MEGYGWGSHLCLSFFVAAWWLFTPFSIFSLYLYLSLFLSLHRLSPPCADPHGLLNLRKVLNALTSGQQWGLWMSWDFEVATSRSDSSELGESRSSWLIRPIWTFGLELVKKSSSVFSSSVFQRQNFWGGTYFLLAYFAYVISIIWLGNLFEICAKCARLLTDCSCLSILNSVKKYVHNSSML